MSLARRLSEPIRVPVRQTIHHHVAFFEDLIHAIKSEIVGKIEGVDARVEDLQHSVEAGQDAIADQIAMQAATVRTLRDEVERLRELVEILERRVATAAEAEAQPGAIVLDELTAAGS